MKKLVLLPAIAGILGAVILYWSHSPTAAASFAGGAALTTLNLSLLVWTWPRILAKKQVAPAIAIIVFKFAILGWILFEIVAKHLFEVTWFAAGFGLVVPAILFVSLTSQESA
jgi:hypothetical protein